MRVSGQIIGKQYREHETYAKCQYFHATGVVEAPHSDKQAEWNANHHGGHESGRLRNRPAAHQVGEQKIREFKTEVTQQFHVPSPINGPSGGTRTGLQMPTPLS